MPSSRSVAVSQTLSLVSFEKNIGKNRDGGLLLNDALCQPNSRTRSDLLTENSISIRLGISLLVKLLVRPVTSLPDLL